MRRSLRHLREAEPAAAGSRGQASGKLVITVPLLNESHRVADLMAHWWEHLSGSNGGIELCLVTTERERAGFRSPKTTTWEALNTDPHYLDLFQAGQTRHLHYPNFNRTYGEQLSWALDRLSRSVDGPVSFYVANVDSRLSDRAFQSVIDAWEAGTKVAQQSAIFLANLRDLRGPAGAEALFQSRWTLEREYFRYLAGTGQIRWMPRRLAQLWYQHAVGHGLLISGRLLTSLGGLPVPKYGLEDAALGFDLRAHGHSIEPLSTVECAEAPTSISELIRQRSTWVRGPLCTPEYAGRLSDSLLVAQGLYDGLKWSLGLPVALAALAVATRRGRVLLIAGWSLELYAPVVATLHGLGHIEVAPSCRLSTTDIRRPFAWLPMAPVTYWTGGLIGLSRLLYDVGRGRNSVQVTTRRIADQP